MGLGLENAQGSLLFSADKSCQGEVSTAICKDGQQWQKQSRIKKEA
jgi:hypothetical protein